MAVIEKKNNWINPKLKEVIEECVDFESVIATIAQMNPGRDNNTFSRRIMKLGEEYGEINEAYLNVTSLHNDKNKTYDDVREELVDLLIVTVDCLLTRLPGDEDKTDDDIEKEITQWVRVKLDKWAKKVGGTITPLNDDV